jgi:hypothetical protein
MTEFASDNDKRPKPKDGYEYVKCGWCGGYGYHFRSERGNATRCEICDGRKYVEKPIKIGK